MSKYIPTIGIETHVQLKTRTKLFSAAGNDARDAAPNTLISHIDVALPGALPVLNEKAVELASRAAFALNTRPQKNSYFERKHYFYPDSPAGYQISQLQAPIIVGGSVEITVGGEKKTININRAQLEADAGKTIHPEGADYSLVDLNRAGTPLLEIVSEPQIHSAAEAKAYVHELYLLMKYADVSDVDLYHGNMRFDVNVSVSTSEELGKRTEVKNLNSFRNVEAAVEYEIKRQTELLERGEEIIQETRGWDEAKQKTTAQRSKEEAHDYRYMPEPDIPPVELSDELILSLGKDMPLMPGEWRNRLNPLGLAPELVDTLLEAEIEDSNTKYLPTIEANLNIPETAKKLVDFVVNVAVPLRREGKDKVADNKVRQLMIWTVVAMVVANKVSSTNARALLALLFEEGILPDNLEDYAKQRDLLQVSDESAIDKFVSEVIAENPKAAQDVKNGEAKAIGFLVGQVMTKSKGQANPGLAQQLIKKQLGV
jgi:aspartyl-tRNA(Asn)/glutamyl-tRNA(Gln) amidotransferase subunit B